ncbi:hypothetical protein BDAP_001366 [Binucleata daphniae]
MNLKSKYTYSRNYLKKQRNENMQNLILLVAISQIKLAYASTTTNPDKKAMDDLNRNYRTAKRKVQAEKISVETSIIHYNTKKNDLDAAIRDVERFKRELTAAENTYKSLNDHELSYGKLKLQSNVEQARRFLEDAKQSKDRKQRSFNLAQTELKTAKRDLEKAEQDLRKIATAFRC